MKLDIDKLRDLAGKATAGPWVLVEGGLLVCSLHPHQGYNIHDMRHSEHADVMGEIHKIDAAFIAAANPATIISLLDALEAANARVKELEIINFNLKGDVRLGRRIISDLEDDQT